MGHQWLHMPSCLRSFEWGNHQCLGSLTWGDITPAISRSQSEEVSEGLMTPAVSGPGSGAANNGCITPCRSAEWGDE